MGCGDDDMMIVVAGGFWFDRTAGLRWVCWRKGVMIGVCLIVDSRRGSGLVRGGGFVGWVFLHGDMTTSSNNFS